MAPLKNPSALWLGALLGVLTLPALAAGPATPASPKTATAGAADTPLPTPPAGVALPYGAGYEQRLRAAMGGGLRPVPLPPSDTAQAAGASRGAGGRGGSGGGGGGRGR
jgi:hypothetical protein